MLSILIPLYNYDVRDFVIELHKQSVACEISFEIRCYDDNSSGHYQSLNRELEQLDHVIYHELPENIGRSAIRNLMAREAQFPYLLFLDCDSFPENHDFIDRYIAQVKMDRLIYGGRTYEKDPPQDKRFYFRWYYGMKREVLSDEQRRLKPYHSFQTNNFVVPRDIFLTIGLNEDLKGYGHEDTLFGNLLLKRKIPVIHIDNPLRHLGLEKADEFLKKTDEGILNLYYLIKQGYDISTIKLVRYYCTLKKLGLIRFTSWLIMPWWNTLLKNLHSTKPCLMAFDLYKLRKLIEIHNYKKRE